MKLNNGGWGYRDMIIYTSIILFALIFAAMSISSFYDDLQATSNANQNNDENVDNNDTIDIPQTVIIDKDYYSLQELKLKNATLDYVNTYSYDLSDGILNVSIDTLVSFDFMEPIYDQTGTNKCYGYSNVFVTGNGLYEIKPYINCSNYITSGY